MNPPDSERDDHKQRVAGLHVGQVTAQHNGPGSVGENRNRGSLRGRTNDADLLIGGDGFSRGGMRFKCSRGGRRVVDLQMGVFGVDPKMERLRNQRGLNVTNAANFPQEVLQPLFERGEIGRSHVAGSSAFGVDRRNIAGERGAQRAAGQVGSGPASELIKARGHLSLGCLEIAARDVAHPRMQFQCLPAAVQVDVVGGMRQNLSVKKMRQTRGGRTVDVARKCPGQVSFIRRVTRLFGGEGRFVEHGNQHDGALEVARPPRIDPSTQKGRAFEFVTMGRAIDDQNRTGCTSPDPGIEAQVGCSKSVSMPTAWQGHPINRGRRITHD